MKIFTTPKAYLYTKSDKGFTIIELMVTIAIAGIIAAIAMPNLNDFLVRMRVDNEVNEMHRLLLTARNSAINTGFNTTVCPLDSTNTCTNNWGNTISVFTNTTPATNDTMNGTDILIKIKEAVKTNDILKLSNAGFITYSPSGRTLNGNENKLSYCPYQHLDASNGIDISTSGRSYVGTETNVSGKYVDRDDDEFKCI
jgi:type IV fimbrial biogenesis protein FimT/type IV fimbrial biogenesis protein FimU